MGEGRGGRWGGVWQGRARPGRDRQRQPTWPRLGGGDMAPGPLPDGVDVGQASHLGARGARSEHGLGCAAEPVARRESTRVSPWLPLAARGPDPRSAARPVPRMGIAPAPKSPLAWAGPRWWLTVRGHHVKSKRAMEWASALAKLWSHTISGVASIGFTCVVQKRSPSHVSWVVFEAVSESCIKIKKLCPFLKAFLKMKEA